jgi:hypothetical protein
MYNNSREDGMSRHAGRTQSRDYRPVDYPPLSKGSQSRYKEMRDVDGDYNYDYAAARRNALSSNVKASSSDHKIALNSKKSVRTSMMKDHLEAEIAKTDNLINNFAQVQTDSLHEYVKSIDGQTNGAWTDWFDKKRKQLMEHGQKAGEKAGLWVPKHKDSAENRGDWDDEDDRHYAASSAKGRHLEQGEIPYHGKR